MNQTEEKQIREDIQRIVHDRPIQIEVNKNANGSYRYSVSYHGTDPDECLHVIEETMMQLELLYGPNGNRVLKPLG